MIRTLLSCVCAGLGAGVGSSQGTQGPGSLFHGVLVAAPLQQTALHCLLDPMRDRRLIPVPVPHPGQSWVQRRKPNTRNPQNPRIPPVSSTCQHRQRGRNRPAKTTAIYSDAFMFESSPRGAKSCRAVRRRLGCKGRLLQGTPAVPRLACMTAHPTSSQTCSWLREGFSPWPQRDGLAVLGNDVVLAPGVVCVGQSSTTGVFAAGLARSCKIPPSICGVGIVEAAIPQYRSEAIPGVRLVLGSGDSQGLPQLCACVDVVRSQEASLLIISSPWLVDTVFSFSPASVIACEESSRNPCTDLGMEATDWHYRVNAVRTSQLAVWGSWGRVSHG